jgi:hypothetical protein
MGGAGQAGRLNAMPKHRDKDMQYDFSQTDTEQLKKSLKFHENDRGTMSVPEELSRVHLIQKLRAELKRRGLRNPD